MYRYDMFATLQGTLRPDLAPALKQRCEMNAAELNRDAAVPNPYLISALQDDIRKHKLELELMEYELASMEQCATKGTADVFQSKLAHMLCVGRRVQTAPRQTPSQVRATKALRYHKVLISCHGPATPWTVQQASEIRTRVPAVPRV